MNIGETGIKGENKVCRYLMMRGYKILDRNFQCRFGEIDIIAKKKEYIVFVEVKTRKSGGMTTPADALTPVKKKRLFRAAAAWLTKYDAWSYPCRFDLACVTFSHGMYQTELISNVIEFGEFRNSFSGGNTAWQPW